MKYSEVYQQMSSIDKAMSRDFTGPLRELITKSVHPIIEDLLQVFENSQDGGDTTSA